MKGFAESNDLFSSIMKGSHLQCILICFSAAITKKELVIFFAGNLSQALLPVPVAMEFLLN